MTEPELPTAGRDDESSRADLLDRIESLERAVNSLIYGDMEGARDEWVMPWRSARSSRAEDVGGVG